MQQADRKEKKKIPESATDTENRDGCCMKTEYFRLYFNGGIALVLIAILILPVMGLMSSPIDSTDLTGTTLNNDYYGFDGSAEDCADWCDMEPVCQGATYVLPETQQNSYAHCWLKKGTVNEIASINCISFLKESGTSGKQIVRQENTKLNGLAYEFNDVIDEYTCFNRMYTETRWAGASFNRSIGRCILFVEVSSRVSDKNTVSVIKYGEYPQVASLKKSPNDFNDVTTLPCFSGNIHCGDLCVNLMTDNNNCGACGRECGKMHCSDGQCIWSISDLWGGYDSILGLTDKLTSLVNLSAIQPGVPPDSGFTEQNRGGNDKPADIVQIAESGKSSDDVVLVTESKLSSDEIVIASERSGPAVIVAKPIAETAGSNGGETPEDKRVYVPETKTGMKTDFTEGRQICPPDYFPCSGTCRDMKDDVSNCGACGNTCPEGYTCIEGSCAVSGQCTSGLISCNNVCVNLLTDAGNCGSCGHTCLTGATCTNGVCVLQMVTTQPTRLGSVGLVIK